MLKFARWHFFSRAAAVASDSQIRQPFFTNNTTYLLFSPTPSGPSQATAVHLQQPPPSTSSSHRRRPIAATAVDLQQPPPATSSSATARNLCHLICRFSYGLIGKACRRPPVATTSCEESKTSSASTSLQLQLPPASPAHQCPQQPGGVECGYYTMKYMHELCTKYSTFTSLDEGFQETMAYSIEEIDEICETWAKYFYNECV
ncbi:uncharacterized protein LOC116004050 [Ipomoea triloba]|uniref:uncharacterized protein LOC116004050 n=1 Tax=Ipomoea triloba TaxID=35885 RepID=UPI00125D4BB8|nr:uncharacterized protein LOC116004050 [Ipomoea triloba]